MKKAQGVPVTTMSALIVRVSGAEAASRFADFLEGLASRSDRDAPMVVEAVRRLRAAIRSQSCGRNAGTMP